MLNRLRILRQTSIFLDGLVQLNNMAGGEKMNLIQSNLLLWHTSALCLRRSVGGQRCSPPPSSRLGKNRGGGVYKKLTPSRPCRLASKRELQQHLMSPSSCAVSASAQQILYIAWPFPPASLSQPCPHVCHAANTPNARAHTHIRTPFHTTSRPHARPLTATHPADMYLSSPCSCIITLRHRWGWTVNGGTE